MAYGREHVASHDNSSLLATGIYTSLLESLLEICGHNSCTRQHVNIPLLFVIYYTCTYIHVPTLYTSSYTCTYHMQNQNRSISESRTGSTFMLYLSAFKELDWEVPDKKEQFCSILSRAPYQCMRIKELYSQLVSRLISLYVCNTANNKLC